MLQYDTIHYYFYTTQSNYVPYMSRRLHVSLEHGSSFAQFGGNVQDLAQEFHLLLVFQCRRLAFTR